MPITPAKPRVAARPPEPHSRFVLDVACVEQSGAQAATAHDPSATRFWLVVDAPYVRAIQDWMARWIDIIDWEVNTVLDDQEVGELLGNLLAA